MSGALNVIAALVGTIAIFAFWVVVIFVIPVYVALVVASWFPQTGQWRKRLRRGLNRARREALGKSRGSKDQAVSRRNAAPRPRPSSTFSKPPCEY